MFPWGINDFRQDIINGAIRLWWSELHSGDIVFLDQLRQVCHGSSQLLDLFALVILSRLRIRLR